LDSRSNTVYIFDEIFAGERSAALESDERWVFRDEPSARYDLVAVVTPRELGRAANASESVIGPGFGAWLGHVVGATAASLTAAVAGVGGAGSMLFYWTVSTLGAAVGGYMAADEDRKQRVAIGGGIGNAVLPILGIGAALGGWIGAKKPDPREVQDLRKRRRKERDEDEARANARGYTNNPTDRVAKKATRAIKNRVLR